MGHESGDIAFAVADSSDIVNCAVGISGVVSFLRSRKATCGSVGSGVAENHFVIFLQVSHSGLVAMVIAVGMRDGNLEDLALLTGVGERGVCLLDANVHVAADEPQAAIPHPPAVQPTPLAKNLIPLSLTQT